MKPSLQLGINQHLTLTPQLQQAIRLLQLSTVELQQEIQQIVEANPMLELVSLEEKKKEDNNLDFNDHYLESPWSGSSNNISNNFSFENFYCTAVCLRDHLRWQLDLTPMSEQDYLIATMLIDAINDDGFLTLAIEDIYLILKKDNKNLELSEIEAVRHLLQNFDPIGCATRDLSETLLVQLQQCGYSAKDECYLLTKKIIQESLSILGQHNYRYLMKKYQINEAALNKTLQVIQKLNPRPGSIIQQNVTEYIIPDLTVKKINNNWQIYLNNNVLPPLKINNYYASLVKRADNSIDNVFLKNNLREAKWFLKNIESRQDTLLKVGKWIVEYQKNFLEHGEAAMKALILSDVASALDLHESTISRVTTQKFMHTPRGVFELKYFFSSHVTTMNGGECSSTAIRAVIKKLIAAENRNKPLSDLKIAELIAEQGISVARRTVAKYREHMGIAPSNERKTLCSST